jgi:diguanylate cyclase (GGDEF)-like protein
MDWDVNIAGKMSLALNATLGSALIVILVLTNSIRKYSSNRLQRNIFCGTLILYLVAIMCYFVYLLVKGSLEMPASFLMYLLPCGTALLLYVFFYIIHTDARIDPLTQVGNRLSFTEFTDRLSRRRTGKSWAIVMIDMDHFKEINDTLGHQEGDTALCDMAAIIKSCIKRNDFTARYGGDEFVLTTRVDKKPESSVLELVENIQKEVDLFNAKCRRSFKLEISYGYDVFTQDGKQSMDDFMNHIDSLMYQHKQSRRRSSDKKGILRLSGSLATGSSPAVDGLPDAEAIK